MSIPLAQRRTPAPPLRWGRGQTTILLLGLSALGLLLGLLAARLTAGHPPTRVASDRSQDTFERPDQRFWGRAADGELWGADANRTPAFSLVGHAGQIAGEQGVVEAILGKALANAEVTTSGSPLFVSPGPGQLRSGAALAR